MFRLRGVALAVFLPKLIEDRKSNATGIAAILTCFADLFVLLALTSPFGKGGLRGIFLVLKSPLAPLC
jgi:hypothetical protein